MRVKWYGLKSPLQSCWLKVTTVQGSNTLLQFIYVADIPIPCHLNPHEIKIYNIPPGLLLSLPSFHKTLPRQIISKLAIIRRIFPVYFHVPHILKVFRNFYMEIELITFIKKFSEEWNCFHKVNTSIIIFIKGTSTDVTLGVCDWPLYEIWEILKMTGNLDR